MPLNVEIASQRSYFRPGEIYRASVEVCYQEEDLTVDIICVLDNISIQCRGIEYVDSNWVSSDYFEATSTSQGNREGRRVVRALFNSQPAQVLERNVFLGPGGRKQFSVNCVLPNDLPPTFKGTSVRYSYEVEVLLTYREASYNEQGTFQGKLTKQDSLQQISFKKAFNLLPVNTDGDEVMMLDVQFQNENECMSMQWSEIVDDDGKTSSRSTEGSSKQISDSAESASTTQMGLAAGSMMDSTSISRFSMPESEMSYAHVPLSRNASLANRGELSCSGQMLLGACTSNQTFNLRFGSESLVLFSFNPSLATVLCPGATLGGVLHLSELQAPDGSIRTCQSYTVMLETEEEINERWKPDKMKFRDDRIIRRLRCEHMEYTGDVLMTNFMFTIPSTAPPSFQTPLVSLRWLLRFEFVVASPPCWVESGEMQRSNNQVETLNWELPIVVHSI